MIYLILFLLNVNVHMWLVVTFHLLGDPLSSGNYCCFPGPVLLPLISFCGLFLLNLLHTPCSGSRPCPSPKHQTWTSTAYGRCLLGYPFNVSMLQLELVSLLNQLLSVTIVIELGATLEVSFVSDKFQSHL